jgi:hypothetical protein
VSGGVPILGRDHQRKAGDGGIDHREDGIAVGGRAREIVVPEPYYEVRRVSRKWTPDFRPRAKRVWSRSFALSSHSICRSRLLLEELDMFSEWRREHDGDEVIRVCRGRALPTRSRSTLAVAGSGYFSAIETLIGLPSPVFCGEHFALQDFQ